MTSPAVNALDEAYFRSVTWCDAILRSPGAVIFVPTCRQPDSDIAGTTQDQLFRKTLNEPKSVPHAIGFYADPTTEWADTASNTPTQRSLYVKEASVFFDLQSGINGFNGTVHGGLISALIDDAMGSLIFINHVVQTTMTRQGLEFPAAKGALDLNSKRVFTASIKVHFKRPLPTPSVVVVTAKHARIEGRKIFLDVSVRGEGGVEFANCEGMWVYIPLEKA